VLNLSLVADLALFIEDQRPEAAGANFTTISVNGGKFVDNFRDSSSARVSLTRRGIERDKQPDAQPDTDREQLGSGG
jgi:hypothetical protein